MSQLSISMLGSFAVTLDGQPLVELGEKSQALLIYLVCAPERPQQRETLMTLLWPEMPLRSAQANLRQALYQLRQALPAVQSRPGAVTPLFSTNRQTVQLNPNADYFADVQRFNSLLDSDPEAALALYRGDFLADFYLPDSEAFAAWAAACAAGAAMTMAQAVAFALSDGDPD